MLIAYRYQIRGKIVYSISMIIMGIENLLQLIGGLALFLYGMQMTSSGMEEAAGNKMKDILQKAYEFAKKKHHYQ